MIIGFFVDTYYPHLNGIVTAVDEQIKMLREKGHTVYIIAPKIGRYKDTDPYMIRIPSFRLIRNDPALMCPLPIPSKNLLKVFRMNFDVIHAHGNSMYSLLGHQVAQAKNIPYVLTFHTLLTEYSHYILKGKVLNKKMIARFLRMSAHICDGIISPSEKMKQALISYGVKKEITVIPNSIDTAFFQTKKTDYFQKVYPLPKDAKILLTVGRIAKEKNMGFLLDSFEKVYQSSPHAHFVIVGYGPDKKLLQEMAKKKKLQKNIHFLGKIQRKELPYIYNSADLFIFASTTEVQGLVVLEAASAGLPIVAVADNVFSDIIIQGQNGYTTTQNASLFAEKALSILNNVKISQQMGKESRKLAEKACDNKKLVHDLETVYTSLIATHAKQKQKRLFFTRKYALKQITKAKNTFDKFMKYWM